MQHQWLQIMEHANNETLVAIKYSGKWFTQRNYDASIQQFLFNFLHQLILLVNYSPLNWSDDKLTLLVSKRRQLLQFASFFFFFKEKKKKKK
jgi:hypothetical protein